jgi:microcystin degradation protein MlrC
VRNLSTNHFRAGFVPIAAAIPYANAGGPYPSDPGTIPYIQADAARVGARQESL